MGIGWSLGFIFISIFCDVFFVIFGSKNFFKRTKEKFSLLYAFPCEFNITERFYDNLTGNIFLIASIGFSVVYYATFTNNYYGFYIVIMIFGILSALFALGLNLFPLTQMKWHIASVVLAIASQFAISVSNTLFSFQLLSQTSKNYYILPIIFSIILAVGSSFIMLNPKFKYDLKYEPSGEGYKRKPFYVACISEWVILLILELNKFVILLNLVNV